MTLVFAREMSAFRASVLEWASSDLASRTKIAVATLREPLRTGDFGAVHAFSRQCEADGVRLSVFGKPRGGLVFDSLGGFNDRKRDGDYLYGPVEDAGAFEVRLGLSLDRVLAPFRRAKQSLFLAALAGVAGMFFVFFALYRQRVRIRELARLERFRREFVADVSHEIKTPLTGILGAADMIEEADGEGKARLAAMVKKEAGRLNGLVQQILDLSRLEREDAALALAEVDLTELVGEVAAKYGVATGRTAGADGAHDVVVADARLVWEAVSNLVENAKRHSGTDDITISLERGRDERIVVEDHGVGIPAAHAARVFERFYRVDPSRAAASGGAGLGLAIVRRIARSHGGDAGYAPASPRGSRFFVSLPLR